MRRALITNSRCLEASHVVLPQLQLGRILDRDDPLVIVDEPRQHVQHRRLARAGASRHEDVQPARDRCLQEVQHRLGQRVALHQVGRPEPIGAEPPDRQHGPIERERRDDGVDAGAVGQARVDHRARLVDAPADRADDALDDLHDVRIVPEHEGSPLETSLTLDVHPVEAIDQNVGDGGVAEQRLERP